MPKFSYKGLNQQRQSTKGTIEAASQKEAASLLKGNGLIVTEITLATENHFSLKKIFGQRVSLKDRIIFTRQLAVMIKSGLPLIEALDALSEQTENKYFRIIINDIIQDIKGGSSLSQSISKYPKVFPPLYINIVKSGEKSGKLTEVLQNMADQLEKDYDLITRVRGAMMYPIVILFALIGVMLVIFLFIMPQLQTVFSDMNVPLPISTRILLGTSVIMRKYFIFILAAFILIIIGLRRYFQTEKGQLIWDRIKIHLPIFGPLVKKIYMSRFARISAMLIQAGLPMLNVIDTVSGVINSAVYRQSFQKISKAVENGSPLSKEIKNDKNFPPMVSHMINIGERSGNIDFVLGEVANFYDKEIENTTRNLSTLIEPILMVIMGIAVGFIVISVISPIYNIAENIS